MKKFFALMLLVSMLAFASSAMAAVSLTPSQSNVFVLAGGAPVELTLTASGIDDNLGPAWSFDLRNNPPSWATLTGTDGTSRTRTLRLNPDSSVAANTYTVTVRVRGSYKPAVHGATTVETNSADIRVVVSQNIVNPTNPVAVRRVLEFIVSQVRVIDQRYAMLARAVVSSPLVRQVVARNLQAFINELNRWLVFLSDASGVAAADIPSDTKVLAEDGITSTGAEEKTLAREAAKRKFLSDNDSERVIGFVEQFRANDTGIAVIDLGTFNEIFWGRELNMNLQNVVDGTNTNIGNEAVFINSSGDVTRTIPAAKRVSTDPTPGFVRAVCYVEAGKTYDPVLYTVVSSADAAAFDSAAGTTVQSVTIDVVENVYVTSTFSPVVPDSAKIAIASAMGIASADLWEFDADVAEGSSWDISAAESAYMLANDIDEVAKLPRLKDVAAGLYVAAISFDNTPRDAQTYGVPTLYPYGVKANGATTDATVYAISNNQAYEVPGSAVYDGMNAYLVVRVGTNGVDVADTDVNAALATIDRPTIAVKLNNVIGVGGSSGGCSAGSAVLALALLGTFIAARKK